MNRSIDYRYNDQSYRPANYQYTNAPQYYGPVVYNNRIYYHYPPQRRPTHRRYKGSWRMWADILTLCEWRVFWLGWIVFLMICFPHRRIRVYW